MNEAGVGFKTKTNKVSVIMRDDQVVDFELKPKREVAADILNVIYQSISK
jgi:phosphopantothenoylcysteine decarboxylase/phosphopantothenate--cysteine ligase